MTAEDVCSDVKDRFDDIETAFRRLQDATLSDVSDIMADLGNYIAGIKHPFHLLERKIDELRSADYECEDCGTNERLAYKMETAYTELRNWVLEHVVDRYGVCKACDGSGKPMTELCPVCAGTGRIDIPEEVTDGD